MSFTIQHQTRLGLNARKRDSSYILQIGFIVGTVIVGAVKIQHMKNLLPVK